MNKDSYDNFMTSFKKNMWDLCNKENIFTNLDSSEFERVKSIFETNIENFKTHILQTNGDNSIRTIIIANIKKDIQNSRQNVETREDISNKRKEKFDDEFQKKQTEFNSLLNHKKPKELDFSDNTQDSPLEADNLEALIQEQLKDRELHMPTPSDESNTVVSDNQFTETKNNSEIILQQSNSHAIESTSLELLIKENESLTSEISKLRQQINSQNDAIHKILSSQILILKKLK
jgi:hypothetical protein